MTRAEAQAEQNRLFPGAFLPDITSRVRRACNGYAPFTPDQAVEVEKMLRGVLDTWEWKTVFEGLAFGHLLSDLRGAHQLLKTWIAANPAGQP